MLKKIQVSTIYESGVLFATDDSDMALVLKHVVRTNKDKSSGQWGGDMSHKMRDMLLLKVDYYL